MFIYIYIHLHAIFGNNNCLCLDKAFSKGDSLFKKNRVFKLTYRFANSVDTTQPVNVPRSWSYLEDRLREDVQSLVTFEDLALRVVGRCLSRRMAIRGTICFLNVCLGGRKHRRLWGRTWNNSTMWYKAFKIKVHTTILNTNTNIGH